MPRRRRLLIHVAALAGAACAPQYCFVAGVRVATPTGPRRIADVRVGDEVYAWSLRDGVPVVRRVAAVHRAPSSPTLRVVAGEHVIAGATSEHPFYDADRRAFVPLSQLAVGARVVVWPGAHRPRDVVVTAIEPGAVADVYNISVDGDEQSYFAQGVLVHNKAVDGGSPQPAQVLVLAGSAEVCEAVDACAHDVGDVQVGAIIDVDVSLDPRQSLVGAAFEEGGDPAFRLTLDEDGDGDDAFARVRFAPGVVGSASAVLVLPMVIAGAPNDEVRVTLNGRGVLAPIDGGAR